MNSIAAEFLKDAVKFFSAFEKFARKWVPRYESEVEPHLTDEERAKLEGLLQNVSSLVNPNEE